LTIQRRRRLLAGVVARVVRRR